MRMYKASNYSFDLSENMWMRYIWKTFTDSINILSRRKERNESWKDINRQNKPIDTVSLIMKFELSLKKRCFTFTAVSRLMTQLICSFLSFLKLDLLFHICQFSRFVKISSIMFLSTLFFYAIFLAFLE